MTQPTHKIIVHKVHLEGERIWKVHKVEIYGFKQPFIKWELLEHVYFILGITQFREEYW